MKTIKLYQQDVELRHCESTLLAVVTDEKEMEALGAKKQKNTMLLLLNQTIFFPEGGGQPCDTGFIDNQPVFYVFEKEGLIYHQISSLLANPFQTPPAGEGGARKAVHCEIDWNRRFLHMQMHCGEHILSGMFYREYGGVNRGFHMGDDYMTIDINLEETTRYTEFTQEMIDRVELLANKAIWDNAPVITRYYAKKADTAGLPLRKAVSVEEDITIVCVGALDNPADCVACCGTHPRTAGQVGVVKIVKAESYKGMTRFYVKAGKAAFGDYALKHQIAAKLCGQYSTEPAQLLDKIKIQDTKNGSVRKELYDLKKNLIDRQAAILERAYKEEVWKKADPEGGGRAAGGQESRIPAGGGQAAVRQAAGGRDSGGQEDKEIGGATPIVIRWYDYFSIDDLQTLGRKVAPVVKGLLLLIAQRENTVLLVSPGKPDCGRLVKENAGIYQGKGGGNATLARAIFPKPEGLETYLDLLEKHLRH